MSIGLRIVLAVVGVVVLALVKWWQPGQHSHVDGRIYRVHHHTHRRRSQTVTGTTIGLSTKTAVRFTASVLDDVSRRLAAAGVIKRPLTGDADFDARVFFGGDDDAVVDVLRRDAGLRAVIAYLVPRGQLSADGREVRYSCTIVNSSVDDSDFHAVAAIADAVDAVGAPASALARFVGIDSAFAALVGGLFVYGVGGIVAWVGGPPHLFLDDSITLLCVGGVVVTVVAMAIAMLLASKWSAQISRLARRQPVVVVIACIVGGISLTVDVNRVVDGPPVVIPVHIDSVDAVFVKKRGRPRQRHFVTLHAIDDAGVADITLPTQLEVNETTASRLTGDVDGTATIGRGALGAAYWIDLR